MMDSGLPRFVLAGEPLPEADQADSAGLVAISQDLSAARLLEGYAKGLFPWYEEGLPVLWWSPDPRAILPFDRFHVPRRLRRTIRSGKMAVTFDRCFRRVIEGCADAHGRGNWITDEMIEAYTEFHELGYAHSVEVWQNGDLVGGLYGVAIGAFFAAESKFHRVRDASKVALVALVERLRRRGFELLDIQVLNPHTARFGGTEIPRREYLRLLQRALGKNVTF